MQQQEQRQTTPQHNTAVMLIVGGLLFLGGVLMSLLGQAIQASFITGFGSLVSLVGFFMAVAALVTIYLLRRKARTG